MPMITPDAIITFDELQSFADKPAYMEQAAPGSVRQDYVNGPATIVAKQESNIDTSNVAKQARAMAVRDTAINIGVKAGLAWQLKNIASAIDKVNRDLDATYDFSGLMIQGRVVPPVITESRDLYNQDGELTIRLSNALYKIERNARFASLAPNWREYLTFPKPSFDRDNLLTAFMPKNDAEKWVWKIAMRDGWNQGVDQGTIMLNQGFDRLNRDYAGMARFHRFVRERKITMPVLASQNMPINLSGQVMAVDEQLLRIVTLPEFNGKIDSWQAIPNRETIDVTPDLAKVIHPDVQTLPEPKAPAGVPPVTADPK
jgi:defect-in-organelle-trafficking protein DotC